jgi:hypothetical protein
MVDRLNLVANKHSRVLALYGLPSSHFDGFSTHSQCRGMFSKVAFAGSSHSQSSKGLREASPSSTSRSQRKQRSDQHAGRSSCLETVQEGSSFSCSKDLEWGFVAIVQRGRSGADVAGDNTMEMSAYWPPIFDSQGR